MAIRAKKAINPAEYNEAIAEAIAYVDRIAKAGGRVYCFNSKGHTADHNGKARLYWFTGAELKKLILADTSLTLFMVKDSRLRWRGAVPAVDLHNAIRHGLGADKFDNFLPLNFSVEDMPKDAQGTRSSAQEKFVAELMNRLEGTNAWARTGDKLTGTRGGWAADVTNTETGKRLEVKGVQGRLY